MFLDFVKYSAELAQMSWLLDPVLDQVGEDELMRLWQKMAVKKGIVEEV